MINETICIVSNGLFSQQWLKKSSLIDGNPLYSFVHQVIVEI